MSRVSALLLAPLALAAAVQPRGPSCQTQSQPNPIAGQYGAHTTGTLNGTVMIFTIPYTEARNMIPAQYAILDSAMSSLFAGYGPDAEYPLIVHAALGHGVQQGNATVPDYSVVSVTLPFVDRLGDGHTSFRYGHASLVSALSGYALNWTRALGPPYATPGTFDPPCDAYGPGVGDGRSQMRGWNADTGLLTASIHVGPSSDNPFSLASAINVTNQPYFASDPLCDNLVTLWNTSLSQGAQEPQSVYGDVRVAPPLYHGNYTYQVWGFRADLAFVDLGRSDCAALAGYNGTGPGD